MEPSSSSSVHGAVGTNKIDGAGDGRMDKVAEKLQRA